MQPQFNLTATLYAKPEKRAALLKLLSSFVDKSRAEQGCVDYHFHVSLDDPNTFYFYENWTSIATSRSTIKRTGSLSRANIWRNPSSSVSSRW
jgi:quinol monooxygenase YgiN